MKPSILEQLQHALRDRQDVYLVGGAIRDQLCQRPVHDYDLIIHGDVLTAVKSAAHAFHASYYCMDEERGIYRIILQGDDQGSIFIDINPMRGNNLDTDLRLRDFTINAIAAPLDSLTTLIDPLHGVQALKDSLLTACSATALQDDPIRVLRAVRLACEFNLRIDKETIAQIKSHARALSGVSAERKRDEFFKGLGYKPALFLRLLFVLGIVDEVLPNLRLEKDQQQHWQEYIATLERLITLFKGQEQPREENLWSGMIFSHLFEFSGEIRSLMNHPIHIDRKRFALWVVAGLLWCGISWGEVARLVEVLILSNHEKELIRSMDRGREWLRRFPDSEEEPERRQQHRYFATSGSGGIDAVVVNLAAELSRDGNPMDDLSSQRKLRIATSLMTAWWRNQETVIHPPALLDGNDVQRILGLPPGEQIGILLVKLFEEQAAGVIMTKKQAIEWIREMAAN